jgi:hypothetical protein
MSKLIPAPSNQSHLVVIGFKATAELAVDLLLRGLEASPIAFDLAAQNSIQNQDNIISEQGKSFDEKGKVLHAEVMREQYFKDYGPAQHLVASTVLAYATLDTVLAEAVRLLVIHDGSSAPKQNKGGVNIESNLKHIKNVFPNFPPLIGDDQTVIDDFSKIRNILIHQGYFVNEHDPRIVALRASDYHVDYFEIRPGFPILLQRHGVGHFVMVCNKLIRGVAEEVYKKLISK